MCALPPSTEVHTTCMHHTIKKMGVEATFVDPDCTEEELNAAFQDNTKAVFGETIANPALVVLDIEKFAKASSCPRGTADRGQYICHAHQLPAL